MIQEVSEIDPVDLAKIPTDIVITAYPLDYTPFVYFSMDATFSRGGGKKIGENLKFDKVKDEFELKFKLEDGSGLDLAFCRPPDDQPIWVAVGPLCPTTEGTGGGTIKDVSVSPDGKLLTATNTNLTPQMLSFALRFTGKASAGGSSTYVYDPRIINGGR